MTTHGSLRSAISSKNFGGERRIMPRYNVRNYKGKWACFSGIIDEFVTPFMPKDEYEKWRIEEYGYTEKDYAPAEKCNMMTVEEAVYALSLNHSGNDILRNLIFAGLIAPLRREEFEEEEDEDN